MEIDPPGPTLRWMHDDLRPALDALEESAGATPFLFRRVLAAGADDTARHDAIALAGELNDQAEAVSGREVAD